ncbi:MAG: TIGR02680 family protein [Selenomonas sp.]|uniref:TIGR02680 family protein n=1 Tax=Selenomonas sp. TaxID=2053611 RepID=UPI0025F44EBC|nr:TIGR02680 family protein [Selenomonas sp.]MCR5758255.1 TIGR02680 family protein [Selenomonas sp.]
MSESRWQAYRAGILNYWYYDEAEFYFADGRLLLRGSNGSGKSVTMQSLVTVLLDGVKRADRLDSFGSKSRTMDDYLLGEKEISDYDERTGYLYLEYKRENSDQYITTGIGLHAKRGNSRVDFWGFVLQNGRRIGEDLTLYHLAKNPETGAEQKIPLTRRELENAIGQDGRVTTEQREYMAMVNQYIFGYEDIGKYEELMKLLIQLRSPKLSRDFKPSVIYEILNASLPTLSDDDLRPLAETLENMEKTRLAIEQLKREQGAFTAICRAYTAYNEAVLAERGLAAAECQRTLNRLVKEAAEKSTALQAAKEKVTAALNRQQELTVEEAALRQEQSDLQENEAYKATEARQKATEQLAKEEAEKKRKEDRLLKKRQRELKLEEQMNREEAELFQQEKSARELLADLDYLAKQADFAAHDTLSAGFAIKDKMAAEHLQLWQGQRRLYDGKLRQLSKAMLGYEQSESRYRQGEVALGEENRRLDDYRHELGKLQEQLEDELGELVKAFYEWQQEWQGVIKFAKEQENSMAAGLRELFQSTGWLDIEEILETVVGEHRRQLDTAIGGVRLKLQELSCRKAEAEEELSALREAKEAEPELGEAYKKARENLQAQKISFVPLYEATEYRSHVTPEMRERIESALMEAGLLNALILEKNDSGESLPEDMRGAVLFAGSPVMMAESLFDYLEPVAGTSGISRERIAEVLSGIAINDDVYKAQGGITLNVTAGAYALGNLAGCAARRPAALFIGRQARENYRRQQIAVKEAELRQLNDEMAVQTGQEQKLLQEAAQLQKARQEFPTQESAQKINDEIRRREGDIKAQKDRLAELTEKQQALSQNLREEKKALLAERGDTKLAFSAAAYEEAEKALVEYAEELHKLTLLQAGYAHRAMLFAQHGEEAAYVREEVDSLRAEVVDKELAIGKLQKTIAALDRQLSELDAAGLKARIEAVIARLLAIPRELSMVSRELGQAEQSQEILAEELAVSLRRQEIYRALQEKWQKLLAAEQQRGFPINEKKTLRELMSARQKNRDNKSLHSLAQAVENQYAQHRDEIAEYRFSLRENVDELGDLPEISEAEAELFKPRLDNLRDYAVRQIALTEAGGKLISPYEQLAALKAHLAEQENLLSEQDKKIYQEIILNSIGRTISDKIYGAEDWIKKMNHLMAKSETSSALRFRLEWKPNTGEDSDKELDTAELVELLHADPDLMKDEDMKKLEEHFSTRIRRAREAAEAEEKDAEAFAASVREQLDYRQWFRFRLYYDKGEQIQRRELTDKAFFRFSGGEKAMAMYVPLFSAAYSRYLDAGKDAPRLITLDEAFAGVDEQNMRDMFRLVEQMGFNYIMNSQAIWGDYDVVPSLNIYELLRPLNANYVSVLGYHWDGKARNIMLEGDS